MHEYKEQRKTTTEITAAVTAAFVSSGMLQKASKAFTKVRSLQAEVWGPEIIMHFKMPFVSYHFCRSYS